MQHEVIKEEEQQVLKAASSLQCHVTAENCRLFVVSGDYKTNRNHTDFTDKIFDVTGLTPLYYFRKGFVG